VSDKVLQFRDYARPPEPMRDHVGERAHSATVIILPVVRIERYEDDDDPPPRRRKRRAF
jgi:hypothetical protein